MQLFAATIYIEAVEDERKHHGTVKLCYNVTRHLVLILKHPEVAEITKTYSYLPIAIYSDSCNVVAQYYSHLITLNLVDNLVISIAASSQDSISI